MVSHASKSTKHRRFLEELEMLDYVETDQVEPCVVPQQNNPCLISSNSSSATFFESNPTLLTSNFDYNTDLMSDESDTISLISDSSIEELNNIEDNFMDNNSPSVLNNVAEWAVSFNITNVAFSALLKILKTHSCHSFFLIDAKTVIKSKSSDKKLQIQSVPPGIFHYFKI